MNTFSKEQLEELFEQSGSIEVPECVEHRYALRRKLLNSQYFDEHRNAMRRRSLFLVPVFASGFAIMVLLVVIQTAPSAKVISLAEEHADVIGVVDPDFLTDGLTATFFDDRPMVPLTLPANTVPFSMTTASVLSIQ